MAQNACQYLYAGLLHEHALAGGALLSQVSAGSNGIAL